MKKRIVDFFPYFMEKELLELRINLLKDYVDTFVICELDKTHSGLPLNFSLPQIIEERNLPKDQIRLIQLHVPDDIIPSDVDRIAANENSENLNAVKARARERLQKNAIMSILDEFSEDTLFLISDLDEIINPKYINWVADMVRNYPRVLIKIPLVQLQGMANLRVFDIYGNPERWDCSMFMVSKNHLRLVPPFELRANINNPFPINYISENNVRVEDMGWHFSWMGNSNTRKAKRNSFIHYDDSFSYMHGEKFNSKEIDNIHNLIPQPGQPSMSGTKGLILKEYDLSLLPSKLFELPNVKNYLLPDLSSKKKIVDVFFYFNEEKLFELRYHILKDYVDEFVISEANYTYSGIPKEYTLENLIAKLGFPREKFKIIKVDLSSYTHVTNPWEREVVQKDAAINYLLTLPDDTVFHISDCDEIIDPKKLLVYAEDISYKKTQLIYIPLAMLYCRADLKTFDVRVPKEDLNRNSFMCSKEYLKINTIFYTRNNKVSFAKIPDEESGWHFSWMGTPEQYVWKIKSFSHFQDYSHDSVIQRFNSEEMYNHLRTFDPYSKQDILTRNYHKVVDYPLESLPKEIFQIPGMKEFLLPERFLKNDKFESEFQSACSEPSDINEHLPLLKSLASECNNIIEMGVRSGRSTRAFLTTSARLTSYDINLDSSVQELFDMAKSHGKQVDYIQADVLQLVINPTDMLFIDTWHTYDQLRQELKLHGNKAQKYLVFHDTQTYGTLGEGGQGQGLLPAIIEFLIDNPHWKFKIHKTNNNGLTVLERTVNG